MRRVYRETDFEINWNDYPKLATIFANRPLQNVYAIEFLELLREARAHAVRYVEDAKAAELRESFEQGKQCALAELRQDHPEWFEGAS